MLSLGIDLAWATSGSSETGVVALEEDGTIVDAGWTLGIDETIAWMTGFDNKDVLAFVDAPLVVANRTGQRLCEKHVGQRYGRWKVACNSTNLGMLHRAGVELLARLTAHRWQYHDGYEGPPTGGRWVAECFPYTTLVGTAELGYTDERPVYKRKPKRVRTAEWRIIRAGNCDDLIRRIALLDEADPPLRLDSHAITAQLVATPSPIVDREYKHREDLIDAALCAWSSQLWLRYGDARSQVCGSGIDTPAPRATIIAPALPTQRVATDRLPRSS